MALSRADADIVRRDPGLPGLATLLSPATLLERLRLACPDADLRDAEPTYVRYKPGTSCIAGFRLDVGGAAVHAYARAHRAGESDKLLKPTWSPRGDTPLGVPFVHLQHQAAVVSFFPNDAELPSLRLLDHPGGLAELLAAVLPGAANKTGWDPLATRVSTLAYKPERRYVGKVSLAGEPVAVVKCYTEAGYVVATRNAKMVKSRGLLRVPRRLGRSERHRVVALEWLPGRPLSEILADVVAQPDWEAVARLGTGLAAFAAKGRGRLHHRRGGVEVAVAQLLEVARVLGVLWPPLARRAATLAERVADRLAANRGRDRPVHGDFYAKQVLLDDDGIAVVDWDAAGLGEPASDIGNFVAHLERHALAGHLRADRVAPAAEALRAGFETAAGKSIAERVQVYTAAQLLRLAPHPFRGREPDWPKRTAAILDQVEQILDRPVLPMAGAFSALAGGARPARPTSVPVIDPFGVSADPAMPFAPAALSVAGALDHLRVALHAAGIPGPFELRRISVTRYKPGRRFLVEYELEQGPAPSRNPLLTVVGKLRAKGADERTHGALQALWSGDFGPDSTDGVSVPRPLGVIPELRMTLQLKAHGEPATTVLERGGDAAAALAARLADVIHKLHRAGVPTARTHTIADELRILHDRLPLVAAERPEWADRIERLLTGCDGLAAAIPEPLVTGIHRDYYPDQVLVAGDRLHLLDLDLYCRGDPALDAGNCIAHLTEQALRAFGSAAAWHDRERVLEDRFVMVTAGTRRPAVRAYTAFTLARHVYISTLFPDRRHLTDHLLDLSQRRVDEFDNGI